MGHSSLSLLYSSVRRCHWSVGNGGIQLDRVRLGIPPRE